MKRKFLCWLIVKGQIAAEYHMTCNELARLQPVARAHGAQWVIAEGQGQTH